MKKYLKIIGLILLGIIFISTFVFLYQKSKPEVDTYKVLVSKVKDIEQTTIATGQIEPRDEVLIKPQISGIIEKVYKEAGQKISKGEVIAKVKVIPELGQLNNAESRLRIAEISFEQSKRDFERLNTLYIKKLISKEEFEKGKLQYEKAAEEKQTAIDAIDIIKNGITKRSAAYSNTMIRSTIDGLILDVPVKEGNSVILTNTFNDGTTIATVANMNDLIFKGNIDETEVGRIHVNTPVKISIGALQDMSFQAKLEYISPKGIKENGANKFEIKAAIAVPDSVVVRSGYSANAEIVTKRIKQAITVPESAISFEEEKTFVYLVTSEAPEQKFKKQEVKIGISDGIDIEIKEGLEVDQKVRGTKELK